MEHESDRIERHIEQTRESLGRNLNELESRVRTSLDWRARYDQTPWPVLGIAFASAAALAAATKRPRRYTNYRSDNIDVQFRPRFAPPSRFSRAWGLIQDALLAAATRQAVVFLSQAVPGFATEYNQPRRSSSPHRAPEESLR